MLKLCRKGQGKWRILTSQRWGGGWCRNQTSLFWIHLNKIVSEAIFVWCQEGSLVCEGARASYFNGLSSFLVLPISWCWLNHQVVSDSWDPMDYTHQALLSMRFLQARILEQVAIFFFRGSSWPRDRTCVSCIAGGFFTLEPLCPSVSQWQTWIQPSFIIFEAMGITTQTSRKII